MIITVFRNWIHKQQERRFAKKFPNGRMDTNPNWNNQENHNNV